MISNSFFFSSLPLKCKISDLAFDKRGNYIIPCLKQYICLTRDDNRTMGQLAHHIHILNRIGQN